MQIIFTRNQKQVCRQSCAKSAALLGLLATPRAEPARLARPTRPPAVLRNQQAANSLRRDMEIPNSKKSPISYNGAPHICPQNCPFPLTDSQTPLPTSSVDPSDLPSQTASRSGQPFCHNPLDRQTDRPTELVGGNV